MITKRCRILTTLVVLALLALCLCALSAVLLWDDLRGYMSSMTGEEDLKEQVKGMGALFLLRLRYGRPDLAPYTPMPHTGMSPFGINTFLEQEVEAAKVEKAMAMIHDAGFRWIRQEFPWEDIEISAKGDFWDHKWDKSAWEKYDRIVSMAEQYDLEIIARLDNPPAWARAQGDEIGSLAPPDDYADFGDFVHTVVARYCGRIRYYQIWNEPNIYPEWGEQPVNAVEYVDLLKIAYTRAKEADPDCVILSAGLAQTIEPGPRNLDDIIYLEQMYSAGVQGYFDIMSVMAYGLWTGPGDHRTSRDRTNFARPELIRQIMVRNGDADKPIWATEIGWNALPKDFPGSPNFGRVTEEQQARYAAQAYQRAQREWPWMGVLNYWFFKRATDLEIGQTFYYFRMVEPDFAPLPVLAAMRDYIHRPPAVHIGFHQEDHWALAYQGDWESQRDERAVLGGYRQSLLPGAKLSFSFVGTDLYLVTVLGPQGGSIRYAVDDGPPREKELVGAEASFGAHIPLARGMRNSPHTVEIIALTDAPVVVDGLIVKRTGLYWWRAMGIAALIVAALLLAMWIPWRARVAARSHA